MIEFLSLTKRLIFYICCKSCALCLWAVILCSQCTKLFCSLQWGKTSVIPGPTSFGPMEPQWHGPTYTTGWSSCFSGWFSSSSISYIRFIVLLGGIWWQISSIHWRRIQCPFGLFRYVIISFYCHNFSSSRSTLTPTKYLFSAFGSSSVCIRWLLLGYQCLYS